MSNKGFERRTVVLDSIEVRAGTNDAPAKIIGHAAVFNMPAMIGDDFREQIAPGAFTEAITRDDVRALFNHDPNFVLGRNKAGTLRMNEDVKGLAIEIDPPDTQWARDLMVSINRGDISQMSFGFCAESQTWEEGADGTITRTLNQVKLFDVSPVTYPAYAETDVAVRALEHYRSGKKPEMPTTDNELLRQRFEVEILD